MSQNKIPYFIQYEENASITSTDIIYFDNGTDIAQAIAYGDFVTSLSISNPSLNIVSKTSNYTLNSTDCIVKCNGTFTISLPTAIGITGKQYVISNSGTGIITIDAYSSQTIQGDLTQDIYQYETITIISDGANWIVI